MLVPITWAIGSQPASFAIRYSFTDRSLVNSRRFAPASSARRSVARSGKPPRASWSRLARMSIGRRGAPGAISIAHSQHEGRPRDLVIGADGDDGGADGAELEDARPPGVVRLVDDHPDDPLGLQR